MPLTTTIKSLISVSAGVLLASSALAQPFFRASCDNRQGSSFADVLDSSDPAQNGYNIDPSEIYRSFPSISFPSNQSVAGANANAVLVINSQFYGANPGNRISGFRVGNAGAITLARTSGNATVRGQSSDTTSVCLTLSGASAATPMFSRIFANLAITGQSTGSIRFMSPSGANLVSITSNGNAFSRVLRLTANGEYQVRTAFDTGFRQLSTNGNVFHSGSTVFVMTCVGDFNASNTTTTQDIFDFLAAWFSNNLSADSNGNNAVTVQDIFDFLASWFNGCA